MLWVLIRSASPRPYHNTCFRGEIRKISAFFRMKKAPYLLLCEEYTNYDREHTGYKPGHRRHSNMTSHGTKHENKNNSQ